MLRLLLAFFLLVTSISASAGEVRIAVASNFLLTINQLAPLFEKQSGHRLIISTGSTGKLYAQITHGAPFDVFLAADAVRPRRLVDDQRVLGAAQTYALGRLILWSGDPRYTAKDCQQMLKDKQFNRLAIANPKIAPYGMAAVDVLRKWSLWQQVKYDTARGENIGQTFQYVRTGNADMGFVAQSQVIKESVSEGCSWVVDASLHRPLVQDAVVLKQARNAKGAHQFMQFLLSNQARAVIQATGYGLPE